MTGPAAPPSSKPAPKGVRRGGELDRRTVALAALVLFGSLVLGIVAMAVFADPGAGPQPVADGGAPHIIDRPNSGTEPTNAGDRGGAEQLLLLAGIVLAIGGIGYVAFRGGSKAKANRDQWKAAGASGRDGALDA